MIAQPTNQSIGTVTLQRLRAEKAQLAELAGELANYEARFGMSSDHLFVKYRAGEMGDNADVFEWQILYKMHQRLQHEIDVLSIDYSRYLA